MIIIFITLNIKGIMMKSVFLILFFMAGCSVLKTQNCTEKAGYEKGYNDAKMGRLKALSQFNLICGEKDSEVAQKGYLTGYEEGSKNATPTFNLSLKGGKVGLVGAYKCQINYRGQTFTKESASESDARNSVLNECNKKFKGCFTMESSVTCSKN